MGRRAWQFDTDVFTWDNFFGILESVKDSVADIFDNPLKFDKLAFGAKIGAALIPGVGGPPARRA
jgi:hypothetical protein